MSQDPSEDTAESPARKPADAGQAPAHVPPQMRDLFTKHEGAVAARPGFRNPFNRKTKAQKKRKKGRKGKR
jgi:hypothetical protein